MLGAWVESELESEVELEYRLLVCARACPDGKCEPAEDHDRPKR